jgi:hypothetical protein
MPKSVPITPRIQNLIAQNNGGEVVDYSQIVVFEASVLNTRPLSKPGSIFDKGRVTDDTLKQMSTYLNSGGFVPLQTLHPNGDELPLGRFFYGEVLPSTLGDGSTELVCLFYLPRTDENVTKLDNGIIDEVSVGFVGQQLLCSECGWDYRGPDATLLNFFDRVCANDHTLGTDGTYLKINGLDRWTETSLVSKGAAHNAKIMGRAKQRLGQEQYERLAASGIAPEQILLTATTTDTRSKKKMDKEMIEMVNQLAELKADAKHHNIALTAKDGEIATLKASVEAKDAEIAKLKEGTELKDATTKLTEAEGKVTELTASKESADAKIAELEAKLSTAETQVAALQAGAGNGGRGNGAGGESVTLSASNAAFKAAPRR